MHAELYTDGIDEIIVTGTIVRVDLVSLSPTEHDANGRPKKVFCQRLIFSPEAFANSVEVMQNALRGLADAGVVTRSYPKPVPAQSPAEPRPAAAAAAPSQPRPANGSANFR